MTHGVMEGFIFLLQKQIFLKKVSDLVKFNWVKSYEDFKAKFGVKENEV